MAEAHNTDHEYHLVDPSPWPALASFGALLLAIGAIAFMQSNLGGSLVLFGVNLTGWGLFAVGLVVVLYVMFAWWRDVIKEAQTGHHTKVVQLHLRYGMILFIASEVMFFVAWFWAFFDASLFAGEAKQVLRTEYTGGHWPPASVQVFDPWHLPLLNTLILLTSGTTVTWAHHALLHNDRKGLVQGLTLTVILGLIFTGVQAYEYGHAAFTFSGGIYGATFFMATGFHGFHVIIGTIFLFVCLLRAMKGHFTPDHHFGFEAAAWYWHFVDVVWLFLFACVYVWGTGSAATGH